MSQESKLRRRRLGRWRANATRAIRSLHQMGVRGITVPQMLDYWRIDRDSFRCSANEAQALGEMRDRCAVGMGAAGDAPW